MLDVMNRLSHGYVAAPVLRACAARGLFDAVAAGRAGSDRELAVALTANPGHLQVALRQLESLDWIRRDGTAIRLGPAAVDSARVPANLGALYAADRPALADRDAAILRPWLVRARGGWDGVAPATAELFDGALLLPILLELRAFDGVLPASLDAETRANVAAVMIARGWMDEDQAWSGAGRALLDRIYACATVASYRPMLNRVDELIFGDCEAVLQRRADGSEGHVDRVLNVLGSGFQHKRYFDQACELVRQTFLHEPFERQPRYIMDVGCGDGALLKAAYEAVRDGTPRGQALDRFPLTLVGVDLNAEALRETGRTLEGLPNILLAGDIGQPAEILRIAAEHGVDPDAILHVRSFLDHDRPFRTASGDTPLPAGATRAISVAPDGGLIGSDEAVRSLVGLFEGWAGVVGRHGLVALEVHALDAASAGRFGSEAESLHFDAYHGFSLQHLVEPEAYLAAAACAGLLPARRPSCHPEGFAFTRITLHHFTRRPWRIRRARAGDLDALATIDARCWPEPIRTPTEVLRRRLESHPEEQFVLEESGRILGACFTQPIAGRDVLADIRWEALEGLRDPAGRTLQLLGLTIDPDERTRGLGDELLDFVLAWAACSNCIDRVCGVSRCSAFDGVASAPQAAMVTAHAAARDEDGRLRDPTLRFHEGHGARVGGLVAGFRPQDAANAGYGVIVDYALDDATDTAEPAQIARGATREAVCATLKGLLRTLLPDAVVEVSASTPFMDLGLDSVQLLRLRTLIARAFGQELESAFLFRHTTLDAVAGALCGASAPAASTPEQRAASEDREAIAIVGLACRFPGGDASGFWDLLTAGRDGVRPPPKDRWWWPSGDPSLHGFEDAGYLDDVDAFDARFFRMSPREAMLVDPQQRILLELVWDALEDAGEKPSGLRGSATGVWVGACNFDYREYAERAAPSGLRATGAFGAILSNRISYVFDWRGPSMTLDTACASSLTALHAALRAMREGDCDLAVVGGVNVIATPTATRSFAAAGMLSPNGRCRSFDRNANGYVRGEGCGVVILKPLERARADGNQVYGLLLGAGVSHGGQSNSLIAPSPQGQRDAILRAYRDARISPVSVSYVETHGTGTAQGDPVEFAGLSEAFRLLTAEAAVPPPADWRCALGSVKSNIGHLEGAAGMAGLIKVLLAFRHGSIPGNLHFQALNPDIELAGTPFRIAAATGPWTAGEGVPRRAAVSSFGLGGANAHILLEDYPAAPPTAGDGPALVVLSARSQDQLRARAAALLGRLRAPGGDTPALRDIAWTLQVGREEMPERLAVVARSLSDLERQLEAFAGDGALDGWSPDAPPTLASAARAWLAGEAVDWRALQDPALPTPTRVSLPPYPFTRQRFWAAPTPTVVAAE